MSKLWKQIKCKLSSGGHNYKKHSERMIHAGMGKMIIHRCTKCEKEKPEFI